MMVFKTFTHDVFRKRQRERVKLQEDEKGGGGLYRLVFEEKTRGTIIRKEGKSSRSLERHISTGVQERGNRFGTEGGLGLRTLARGILLPWGGVVCPKKRRRIKARTQERSRHKKDTQTKKPGEEGTGESPANSSRQLSSTGKKGFKGEVVTVPDRKKGKKRAKGAIPPSNTEKGGPEK